MTNPITSHMRLDTRALLLPLALACALAACNKADPPPETADATTPDTAISPPDPNDMSSASGGDTTAGAAVQTMPADPTMPDAGTGAPNQAEALALLSAINEHEIAAAEQARSKGVDGEVLAYADLMHSEHSKNLTQTRALDPAAEENSPRVTQQKEKGKAELDALATHEGDAYEKAYIDAMVKGHQEALNMLDTQLIPAAQGDAVRQHLTTTRQHVATHLEKAKALQQK